MAWKSRIGKLPPANYYAQIMAYLAMAYPEAEISQRTMTVLKPLWDKLWQDGRGADIVAKTTCSCDGKSITASPAMDLAKLPKGAVRAPTKTDRGQLFEPTRMRESAEAEKAKRQARQLEAQIGRITTRTTRLSSRAERARSDAARTPVLAELEKRRQELARKQAEAAQIAERLAELRKQIGKVGIQLIQEEKTEQKVEKKTTPPKEMKPPKAPKPLKPPTPPKEEKPKRTGSKQADQAPASEAAKEAAILAAIQGALPGLAEKLAEKMKKAS